MYAVVSSMLVYPCVCCFCCCCKYLF